MPDTPEINFARIRPHHGKRDHGFEELVRQLIVADPPSGYARLEHKGAGSDGGVEILVHLRNGDQVGYQAKYFIDVFGAAQIGQIRDSFRRALVAYPSLTRFVVALPRNLSGGTARQTQRKLWDAFVAEAEAEARALFRTVTVELWDETALLAQLTRPQATYAGIKQYWFDTVAFAPAWFADRFRATVSDLGERYLPADHVDVSVQTVLDVLVRGPAWVAAVEAHRTAVATLEKAATRLAGLAGPAAIEAAWQEMKAAVAAVQGAVDAIDFMAINPIDLSALTSAARALRALPAYETIANLMDISADEEAADPKAQRRRDLTADFMAAVYAVMTTAGDIDFDMLKQPRLLVIGEAGAGKSHSLAHLVEQHLAAGAPALMFLGQHFTAGDPRGQMLGRIGLPGLAFDTLLGTLQAVAQASGKPGLVVIDAINEAHAPYLWSGSLSGLAADIARFPALAFVISCRDVYEDDCVPASLEVARAYHEGFDGDASAAAKAYLDRHGIDRPGAPFYDPAFSNPLLLSTCVHRMVREGLTAFPVGIEGVGRLFDFWLDGVEDSLLRRGYKRITRGDGRLRAALHRFADQLALEGVAALPIEQARDLLEAEVAKFSAAGPADELLWRLLAEGVLRRDPVAGQGETIAFTFQRFSDHFIAQAILRLYDTPAALADALRPDGEMRHLVTGRDWRSRGVVEALMAQTPERLGVELPDLEPDFGNTAQLPKALFISSLRWRPASAVTARTVVHFEHLEKNRDRYSNDEFTILLQVATTPDHALNADYLHDRLSRQTLPERDAEWVPRLYWAMCENAPAAILLDWALTARTDRADPKRVRLAAIVLAWFCLSPYRPLRDHATKALSALFLRSPGLVAPTIDRFAGVDDPYVLERVLAAALGACCHLVDTHPEVVEAAAAAADQAVFLRQPVTHHAFIRRYARRIVDLAARRPGAPAERAARAQPPYASAPITDWPTIENLRPHEDSANRILWSTVGHLPSHGDGAGHMAGDFGRYVMGSKVDDFSAVTRQEDPPLTGAQLRAQFWAAVASIGGEFAALGKAAREALEAVVSSQRRHSWVDILHGNVTLTPEEEAEDEALRKRSIEAQAAFVAAIPDTLRIYPAACSPFSTSSENRPPSFSRSQAQRWVAWRALDLGWSKDLHEEAERYSVHSSGRNDHAAERIGKKYQWIAYHELLGYFGDHHWFLDWHEPPRVLERMEALRETDIDPTYLEPAEGVQPKLAPPALGLAEFDVPPIDSAEAAMAWARTESDLPRPDRVVEGRDAAGGRWWLISGFTADRNYYEKLQAETPTRTGQESVDMILMRPADARRLHEVLSAKRMNVIDLNDHSEPYERLYGEHRGDLVGDDPGPLRETVASLPFGRLSVGFSPKRGDYDHSGLPDKGFRVPRSWLLKALDLRPAGAGEPWFVDAARQPILVDPRILGLEGRPVVNADLLEPLLDDLGVTPVWVVWAERDGGDGAGPHFNRPHQFTRETYAGLWWRENGVWKGSNWHVDENQLSPNLDDLPLEEG